MTQFKVKLNGKLYDKTFTPEQIGSELTMLLKSGVTFDIPEYCNPTIVIKMVKEKPTKKRK